jgi:hypothetical protein
MGDRPDENDLSIPLARHGYPLSLPPPLRWRGLGLPDELADLLVEFDAQLRDCECCRHRQPQDHCGGRLLTFPDRPSEPGGMGEAHADSVFTRAGFSLDTLRRVLCGTEPPARLWEELDEAEDT